MGTRDPLTLWRLFAKSGSASHLVDCDHDDDGVDVYCCSQWMIKTLMMMMMIVVREQGIGPLCGFPASTLSLTVDLFNSIVTPLCVTLCYTTVFYILLHHCVLHFVTPLCVIFC